MAARVGCEAKTFSLKAESLPSAGVGIVDAFIRADQLGLVGLSQRRSCTQTYDFAIVTPYTDCSPV